MSFSSQVKTELCGTKLKKSCCMLSELQGLFFTCGKIVPMDENALYFHTSHGYITDRIVEIATQIFSCSFNIIPPSNHKITIYSENIASKFTLTDLNECCQISFLRGMFLGTGSVNQPEKGYHLEIIVSDENLKMYLEQLLLQLDIKLKLIMRNEKYVFYNKDSEQICDILGLLGASTAMMELINVKIEKEIYNNTNRLVNAETANMDKIISAALTQIAAIKKVKKKYGNSGIPEELEGIIKLRLKHPEYSLLDIGKAHKPPLSKSCVNHRMKKIMRMGDEI